MKRAWLTARRIAAGSDGFGLVEALIAVTILVIGLIAVSGLSLAAATQARVADWQADQVEAGQIVLEGVHMEGFASAASGTDTVTINGHDFVVSVSVSDISGRIKEVQAQVAAVGSLPARTFVTRLYSPRSLPAPPPSP